jgi:hexosaminidase
MLSRLVESGSPDALTVLGDVVEPVKQLGRGRLRAYTSLTPMNRLVDAVPPESVLAREFNQRVDLALTGPQAMREQAPFLRTWLARWRENHALLQPQLQTKFLLAELESISQNLSSLAAAGLQALDYLESGGKPPDAWALEQTPLLQKAERPDAEMLIMILPGVRNLVAAATRRP